MKSLPSIEDGAQEQNPSRQTSALGERGDLGAMAVSAEPVAECLVCKPPRCHVDPWRDPHES
jgi:hypothetical protein